MYFVFNIILLKTKKKQNFIVLFISPPQSKPKVEPPVTTRGASLMDDLHQRLSMRRKGISGNNNTETSYSMPQKSGVMNRISAMIPAPPPTAAKDTSSNSSDDDDWN